MDAEAFADLSGRYPIVLMDVGCGDGAFSYRVGRERPDMLCVGLDPNRATMAEYARRSQRKPARGGRDNVLYVVGSVELPPAELVGAAHMITINFPWAALLRHVALGDATLIAALRQLAAPSCLLQLLLNSDVEVAGLPPNTLDGLHETLVPALAEAGFSLRVLTRLSPGARVGSRWGGRLIRGSGRRVLLIRATRGEPPAALTAILDSAIGGHTLEP